MITFLVERPHRWNHWRHSNVLDKFQFTMGHHNGSHELPTQRVSIWSMLLHFRAPKFNDRWSSNRRIPPTVQNILHVVSQENFKSIQRPLTSFWFNPRYTMCGAVCTMTVSLICSIYFGFNDPLTISPDLITPMLRKRLFKDPPNPIRKPLNVLSASLKDTEFWQVKDLFFSFKVPKY